jgi:hypothetical protein
MPSPYAPETWVDDDGSGTVGTEFTAARMNNIEQGILNASEYGFTIRLDEVSSTISYVGEADPGSAEGAAVWRIKKVDMTDPDLAAVTFADGDSNFDNIWNDRLSYIYS